MSNPQFHIFTGKPGAGKPPVPVDAGFWEKPTVALPGGLFTSDRRLYLTKDGKVAEEDDPKRNELLVGVGGTLPMERAHKLGLVDDDGKPVKPETPDGETDRAVKPTEPDKPARPSSKDEGEIGTLADEAKKQARGR